MQQEREKRDRRWYLFPVSTLGAAYFTVHGGTGRFFFFCEAGRGGVFFFPRRDGAVLFFFRGGTGCFFSFSDGTGRGGFYFFSRAGTGRLFFGGSNFFGGTGQNRYTVPPAVHVKPWFFPACSHAHSFSKYRLLSDPLGLCSFHPLLQSGKLLQSRNLMPMFGPASLSIVQRFVFVSDIFSIIVHLLSFLQFKVAFDTLLARAPALEQFFTHA